MAEMTPGIRVQVCFARPEVQVLRDIVVPAGASVGDAIHESGLPAEMPEIDLTTCKVGVYGKLKPLDAPVREHDRIEIYRPLLADPKETRRKRAAEKEAGKPAAT
jgi:putative ubiquitin-RnfH superfamily antitoxin RatB of RatAB toxin-antitoxin module